MPKEALPHPIDRVLITGATSGIGLALAHFFSDKKLILTGRNTDQLPQGQILTLDLAESRKPLIELIQKNPPDLLINNAGFGLYGPTCSLSTQQQLDMIEVNVKAAVEIAIEYGKALLAHKRRGTLLNISSGASFFSYPHFNTYAASKTFLMNFSLALDTELRPHGIRSLCACPGPVATNFRTRATGKNTPSIPLEKAVQYLWHQILTQKPLLIFDRKTHLRITLARLLPRAIRDRILIRTIKAIT